MFSRVAGNILFYLPENDTYVFFFLLEKTAIVSVNFFFNFSD